ncbi:hypothetical protein OCAR_5268 [Afipia carboxidovorans OM5]|nr:hypothetical protein OCAR_5268 [Afipia carboxidovorans OM5]
MAAIANPSSVVCNPDPRGKRRDHPGRACPIIGKSVAKSQRRKRVTAAGKSFRD